MKAIHQLKTFFNILEAYHSDQPLHRFLPQYYRQNKQMGSTDRRIAGRLIYNYFRLGNALANKPPEERLFVAEFFCNDKPNSFLIHFKPEWELYLPLPPEDKISKIQKEYPDFNLQDVFPMLRHLTQDINQWKFLTSFFMQPDLFIRVRTGQEKRVMKLLADADVRFQIIDNQTFALPIGTKLDVVIPDRSVYEIQDLSSQKTGAFFKPKKWDKWWDCCAASGGKSLMLFDEQPDLKLLVSDNRENILDNLDERFRNAGLKNYHKKVLDLTLNQSLYLHDYAFDGIIFDAPCSGSGTWGRTPEMLTQFEEHKIKFYTQLQKKIAQNVVGYLKKDAPLIYITCSVFKDENEEQVLWLQKTFDLRLASQELIKGYDDKADTLFVARLLKN